MIWHLLPVISAPMSFQMALDEAFFQKVREDPSELPIFRCYFSYGPWITAGCSCRDDRDLSKSGLISENPEVPVAKRLTGGGCVLHGEDLIFSLIARYQIPPFRHPVSGQTAPDTGCRGGDIETLASVQESYKKIHACVAAAFWKLGMAPRLYGEDEDFPKGSDCFSFPVASDLEWKGRKIAGGAQKRSGGVLLHHESIRIPPGVSSAALIEAVRAGFSEVLGVSFSEADLDPGLFFQAATVAHVRHVQRVTRPVCAKR